MLGGESAGSRADLTRTVSAVIDTDGFTAAIARAVLVEHEGVAHIRSFLAAGLTRRQVAALYRVGLLKRPRIGWYADPALPMEAIRAIRVGGVLGCISAARSWGLPVPDPEDDELHVSVEDDATRLRDSRNRTVRPAAGEEEGVHLHWLPRLEPVRGYRASVLDVLLQLAYCVPFEWLVAAIDRALHVPRGGSALLSAASWALLRPALPERLRRAVDLADGRAESPIETIVRLGLVARGMAFGPQVWVTPLHRVDFLIGARLVIEVDGRRHHDDPEAFERDRERDALLAIRGFRVLRFSYRQVTEDLPWVLDVIQSVAAQYE